ncbi:MAG: hypothetical protein LBV23_07055 [Deltaproteobacteria bacterium]|nr:hypothetical protein [Deltaproteobacteria bacterium]
MAASYLSALPFKLNLSWREGERQERLARISSLIMKSLTLQEHWDRKRTRKDQERLNILV